MDFSKALEEFKLRYSTLSNKTIFIFLFITVLFKNFKRFLVCSILITSEDSLSSAKKLGCVLFWIDL